ncbi:glycine betaine ABC transporter substrate-binding protein [Actinopolymorpha alba]|uniref:glycine betaine ABC transporter substrate-binding protein n=1 Tax=Actinopolymorpha alba TaxID=533267 RepID=UPI00037B0C94|nr:glycine betaine ABC transporter substrate-binding protein [Actinopolymorpha alba]
MRRGGPLRHITTTLAALFALAVVASCGTIGGANSDNGSGEKSSTTTTAESGGGKDKTIRIGWIPWDENIVTSHLWKQALESKGYKVELVQLDPGPLFTGMAKGDIDVFLDGWLPVTHETYWKQYSSQLEDLGIWYDNAKLALAVPDYVKDVKTIEDLKGKAGKFDGKIVGIEPGAGLMRVTEKDAMPAYGLDGEYQLVKSSTPAMLAQLDKAVKAKQPIVVTLWRPHWAYAKLPMRDLEDPKGSMGKAEQIHVIARKGFQKDFPEVAGWLSSFKMNDKDLGTLEDVALNQHKGKEAEGVTAWMEENPDFVAGLTKK